MTEPKTNFIANDLDLAVKRDFLIRDRGYSPDMLINPDDVAKIKAKEDIKISNDQLVRNEQNAFYAQQQINKSIELSKEEGAVYQEAKMRAEHINSDDVLKSVINSAIGFATGGIPGAVAGAVNPFISKMLGFNIPEAALAGLAVKAGFAKRDAKVDTKKPTAIKTVKSLDSPEDLARDKAHRDFAFNQTYRKETAKLKKQARMREAGY
jgi:hypothetical protein